jgi:hypothetical protein
VPRYFFHVHDGKSFPDREGTEFPDLDAVRLEAVRLSGELLRDGSGPFWKGEQWSVEVTDAAGVTQLTLNFTAVEAPGARRPPD